jgi:hypothetical protein
MLHLLIAIKGLGSGTSPVGVCTYRLANGPLRFSGKNIFLFGAPDHAPWRPAIANFSPTSYNNPINPIFIETNGLRPCTNRIGYTY